MWDKLGSISPLAILPPQPPQRVESGVLVTQRLPGQPRRCCCLDALNALWHLTTWSWLIDPFLMKIIFYGDKKTSCSFSPTVVLWFYESLWFSLKLTVQMSIFTHCTNPGINKWAASHLVCLSRLLISQVWNCVWHKLKCFLTEVFSY